MPVVTTTELLEVIRILINPPWGREIKGLTAAEIYDIYGGTLLDALNTRDPEELVQEYRVWRSKHPNGLKIKEEN